MAPMSSSAVGSISMVNFIAVLGERIDAFLHQVLGNQDLLRHERHLPHSSPSQGFRFITGRLTPPPFVWSLTVVLLELGHEGDERLDAGLGHGIVDARAHAAHRAMALDGLDAVGLRLGHEQRIQLVGARDEGHVHERAILLAGGAAEQLALIEVIVQNGGLLLVALGHNGQASISFSHLNTRPQM